MKGLNWINGKTRRWTDLRLSSAQFWLSSPTDSSFTPESFRLLLLRSSNLRWDGLDFRAEATTSQWVSESPQLYSLSWHRYYKNVTMKDETLYLLHAFDVKTFCSDEHLLFSSVVQQTFILSVFDMKQWFSSLWNLQTLNLCFILILQMKEEKM